MIIKFRLDMIGSEKGNHAWFIWLPNWKWKKSSDIITPDFFRPSVLYSTDIKQSWLSEWSQCILKRKITALINKRRLTESKTKDISRICFACKQNVRELGKKVIWWKEKSGRPEETRMVSLLDPVSFVTLVRFPGPQLSHRWNKGCRQGWVVSMNPVCGQRQGVAGSISHKRTIIWIFMKAKLVIKKWKKKVANGECSCILMHSKYW